MIEYHGWISLAFSDYHVGNKKQNEFLEKFKAYLELEFPEFLKSFGTILSHSVKDIFSINGVHNHKGSIEFYPIQIFKWVAKNGPGSYGLLYIQDDEDSIENHSVGFRVWVLKRGNLEETNDPFLSPFFPECAKEFNEENPPKDLDFDH